MRQVRKGYKQLAPPKRVKKIVCIYHMTEELLTQRNEKVKTEIKVYIYFT